MAEFTGGRAGTHVPGVHYVLPKSNHKLGDKLPPSTFKHGRRCNTLTYARKVRTTADILVREEDGMVISICSAE